MEWKPLATLDCFKFIEKRCCLCAYKNKKSLISLLFSVLFLVINVFPFTESAYAYAKNLSNRENKILINKNYLPYLQIGGTRLFNVETSKAALTTDLFLPIWQEPDNLIFSDLRTYNLTGKPFEGNIQFGYRHQVPKSQRLYGVYISFDRGRTWFGNYFNQLVLGGECWINRWFIGSNIYKPIGVTEKNVAYSEYDNGLWLTKDRMSEEAVPGIDAEVGYEFTKRITGYAGGYYFNGKDVGTKYGPRARVTYDFFLDNGDRILGIFDKVGLETGIQQDKPQGTIWYLSANIRIGWLPSKQIMLPGVTRHMIDPVRRDANIVTMTNIVSERAPSVNSQKLNNTTSNNESYETTNPIKTTASSSKTPEKSLVVYSEGEIKPAKIKKMQDGGSDQIDNMLYLLYRTFGR